MPSNVFKSKDKSVRGRAIKIARIKAGLRQVDLAEIVGVSELLVSRLETGRTDPTQEVLARIEKAVGLDIGTEAIDPNPRGVA